MTFKDDGTRLFVTWGTTPRQIKAFDLSTAWDVSTRSSSAVGTLTPAIQFSGFTQLRPTGLHFKPDGSSIFYSDFDSDKVVEHALSTAWDLNSASATATRSFQISGELRLEGLYISPDGTKMFVNGYNTDLIRRYDLSTAWDITTASATHNSQAITTVPLGLFFKSDGTKVFVVDNGQDRIRELTCPTPWDVNGLNINTHQTSQLSVGSRDTAPNAVYISPDGNHLYFSGGQNDNVYQYDL